MGFLPSLFLLRGCVTISLPISMSFLSKLQPFFPCADAIFMQLICFPLLLQEANISFHMILKWSLNSLLEERLSIPLIKRMVRIICTISNNVHIYLEFVIMSSMLWFFFLYWKYLASDSWIVFLFHGYRRLIIILSDYLIHLAL